MSAEGARDHHRVSSIRRSVRLEFDRALREGFLANASIARQSGEYAYRSWVTLSTDGRLAEVADQPTRADAAMVMRSGDLRLREPWPWEAAAYRPRTRTVFKLDPAPWEGRRASMALADSGAACSTVARERLSEPLHSTVDDAQPWLAQDLSWLAGDVRPFSCSIHPERMVVVTMGPRDPDMVYTLATSDGGEAAEVLSEHPLGDEMNGYDLRTYPDGTIAAGTHGGGVYVGTDSTNTDMRFRSWGRSHSNRWDLVGANLILVASSGELRVSTDRGETWRIVDLELP